MKFWYKLRAVFNPEVCLNCGREKFEKYYSYYINGHTLLEEGYRCVKCKTHHLGWMYGSYDDPFWYMETKWQRFKYLFLGVY